MNLRVPREAGAVLVNDTLPCVASRALTSSLGDFCGTGSWVGARCNSDVSAPPAIESLSLSIFYFGVSSTRLAASMPADLPPPTHVHWHFPKP